MIRPLSHSDYEELLGAYALDAVDGAESAAVEVHLKECPRCRAEVTRHRETAALLGHAGATAPEGLWDRIAGELTKVPPALALIRAPKGPAEPVAWPGGSPEAAPSPAPASGPLAPASERPSVGSPGASVWRRRVSVRPVVALVSVAAVVIGVLGFELTSLQGQVTQVRQSLNRGSIQRLADAVQTTPGHETVALSSPVTKDSVLAVIAPSGHGYLIDARLPRLASKQTYQLWGISQGNAISLGLLGASPTPEAFNVDFGQVTQLMITVEPVGGVSVPNSAVVASGSAVTE